MVRNNQKRVAWILEDMDATDYALARKSFHGLHKHDRDALLIPNGILTDEQIEILSPGRLSPDTEAGQ